MAAVLEDRVDESMENLDHPVDVGKIAVDTEMPIATEAPEAPTAIEAAIAPEADHSASPEQDCQDWQEQDCQEQDDGAVAVFEKTLEQDVQENVENEVITNGNEVDEVINEQELKYWKAVKENPSDFTSWTYLLQFVEQENKLASAQNAFNTFFKRYPYCYGYWKKYADMERKNGNIDKAKEVFEQGVTAISYSVDLWVHYLNFSSQTTKGQPDGPQVMRSLFERAVATAGQDYRSDKLWDAYIEWEKSQGQLQRVTALYDKLLTVPTQHYAEHFEKLKEHINTNPVTSVLLTEELLKLRAEVAAAPPGVSSAEDEPLSSVPETSLADVDDDTYGGDDDVAPGTEKLVAPGEEEAGSIVLPENDAETLAIREKVIAARAEVYAKLEDQIRKHWVFEDAIKRPYFHVKPLERVQLKNWRDYLEYETANGEHDKVVILFERCVIACALYEDFWQRYASYIECHSVEECSSVYSRACTIHLPRKPNIHLAWAAFEEEHGNYSLASKILQDLDTAVPGLVTIKLRRINLDRRCNNLEKAANLYEEALQGSSEQEIKSFYAIRYSRFLAKFMNDSDKACEIIKQAIENDKDNKRLYLVLLDIQLTTLPVDEDKVEEVFEVVKNSNLDSDVKQGFSQRRLEFLEDFCCNITKIMKATEAHSKLYKVKAPNPASNTAGKKRSSETSLEVKSKVSKTEGAVADSSQHAYQSVVSSGTEAYDPSYSAAYSASVAAAAAYSYATPQNQWAAYTAAQPASYNYNQWYYGQAHTTPTH